VLVCRAAGGEVQLSFAALGDLLGDVLEETLPELPPPQRRALEVALLLEESRGPPPDQRAIALAVLSILRVLARSRPVLIAVDDIQWLDRPTEAVLEFALRRLRREPIALLGALRVEVGDEPLVDLGRVFPEERRIRLYPGSLSVGALHRLLRARLGIALARPLLLRVHGASGGNPFYALELAGALQRVEGRPDPAELLPLTASLRELVRVRLSSLPPAVQDTLLIVAALSAPTVSVVEAVVAGGRARSRLAAAVAAGVLEVDGDRISFAHPLLASGIYSAAGPDRRRRLHRRLAAVVTDQEEQARHLALGVAGRDAKVASALDRAAGRASDRGASHAAAELYELAADLTPAGAAADVRRRKLDAADAHVRSGAIEQGTAILNALLGELPPGNERGAVLVRVADAAVDLPTMFEFAERARREATDDGVLASAHLLIAGSWPDRGIDHALLHGRLALECAERTDDRALVAKALTRLAQWELWAGRTTPGLLDRALAVKQPGDGLRGYADPRMPLALRRMYQGRLPEARNLFDALLAEAEGDGDEIASLAVRGRLVDVELRAGNWPGAASHARAAFEQADQIGLDAFNVYWTAWVDAHLGRVDDARRSAELAAKLARKVRSENTRLMSLGVLGFVELSLGNGAAAREYVTPALDWLIARGLALATFPLAPYAIEAIVAAGEIDRARELIAQFEGEAHALESAWGAAIAARCRGLAAAADGDLTGALTALERAMALVDDRGWPFERGRTLLALGRTQRRARQKRAARESLEAAHSAFDALGARLWAEQARRELLSIGGRRASGGRLTTAEERVAALVAIGQTNREVAAELYVTERTVEGHLTHIYAKLGVRSRSELARRLAAS
jgi:DNA-binding CsgD family transcriptional regulator